MPVLHFTYRDSSGIESERTLTSWKENSRYIQGRSATDSLPKTFRKDQILQFHAGRELLLGDAAPLAPAPKPKVLLDDRLQVLFTGFKAAARAELEEVAVEHGFRVMKTASKSLAVLCIGDNAGPTKVQAAHAAGAFVVTDREFWHLLMTGEVPC